ncbi:fimbria/pilus periplasmic chaperone [Qipengyuania sp. GH38]|uniref:fimbrial biogenesis chaperone n=1 Tax=Qipengyuania intermedia TaxID=2867244 RepID=UPI001C86E5CA|nr:fimbria/pilus periplasmic chaperone [Qipengyuania intermedia]MBX7513628.1 fimbria/pilus periplasmic chaperone [Qipengyuania intermedia]
MGRFTRGVIGACLASAFVMASAQAFEVQPMRHSLFPAEGKSSGLVSVKNTRSEPLPLEVLVQKRVYDEEGNFTVVDATEDFVIFPAQAFVQPNENQAFRFQYVGDPEITQDAAYTLLIREVPVEPDEGFTGLQYVYAFGVALYIEDEDRLSKIAVREAVREENNLKIRLQNESDSFARLSNDRFILTQGDKRVSLAGDNLTGVIDKSVLSPRATVLVTMDLSELDLAEGDVSVRVEERAD